jgi:ABC-2 type transport system permease protein
MRKIFLRMWQVTWAEQWQYRGNLLTYALYGLISPIVFLSVWRTIATSQDGVKGLTANDFTAYYLVLLMVDTLTSEITLQLLAHKIQDGSLSGELLLPVHPILTRALVSNVANKTLISIALLPIWGVLVLLFRPDFSGVAPLHLLLALPAIGVGFAIHFLLGALITCAGFWITRVYALSQFIYAFATLLGGAFVPLSLLPDFARTAAQFLPFQLYLYFPIELILGQLNPGQIGLNFALQVFWLLGLLLAFLGVWRAGLKRFSAVGA